MTNDLSTLVPRRRNGVLSSFPALICALTITGLLGGCAAIKSEYRDIRDQAADALLLPEAADAPERMFAVASLNRTSDDASLLRQNAPVFLTEADWSAWNRIGKPQLHKDHEDRIIVRVDPTLPTIYGESRTFAGASGNQYTNLIYRVHFERVPLRFKPLNITAGRNPGLIVVTTLNDAGDPVMHTAVHSCGCYVAITPTDKLPAESRPEDWAVDEQIVFREKLPGLLVVPQDIDASERRLVLTLRDGSHRVAGLAYDSLTRSSFKKAAGVRAAEPVGA